MYVYVYLHVYFKNHWAERYAETEIPGTPALCGGEHGRHPQIVRRAEYGTQVHGVRYMVQGYHHRRVLGPWRVKKGGKLTIYGWNLNEGTSDNEWVN